MDREYGAASEKSKEELVLYRSEHINLSARWLNDSKTIIYKDLPDLQNHTELCFNLVNS